MNDDWNEVSVENPFPLIFKTKYDFRFEDIRSKVEDHVASAKEYTEKNNRTTPEGGGGISSVVLMNQGETYRPPHLWKEFEFFMGWMQSYVDTVWSAWDYTDAVKKAVSESWINAHPKGGWTNPHTHHNVHLAMVAYLHVPENSGNLMVKNPMSMYHHGLPLANPNNAWKTINIETDDVVILPAWLEHMTQINHSEENRYIMSLNVKGFL